MIAVFLQTASMLPIASLRHPEFVRGLKDCLPVLFGMLPFALILGAQAAQKGMSLLETVLMMGLNYAGGSEFAAVGLWASPIPVLLIIAMTAMINSRHILMGAALVPHLRGLPLKKLLPTLFVMTDETWAMGIADAKQRGKHAPLNLPYYWGTAASLYVVWVLGGGIGAWLGPVLGDLQRWGFGMAFPAVFLVLLRGMWRGWRRALPWLVSAVAAAAVWHFFPQSGWYVPVGAAAGLLAAALLGEAGENT